MIRLLMTTKFNYWFWRLKPRLFLILSVKYSTNSIVYNKTWSISRLLEWEQSEKVPKTDCWCSLMTNMFSNSMTESCSVFCLWIRSIVAVFRHLCPIVEHKYIFNLCMAENDCLLMVLVAGLIRIILTSFTTSEMTHSAEEKHFR